MNRYVIRASEDQINKMRREYLRLKSFEKNSCLSRDQKENLAKSGFFWLALGDYIFQCAFCRMVVTWNNPNGDVNSKHLEYSPHCPFIHHPLTVGNLEILNDKIPTIFCTPRHYSYKYEEETERIETFQYWPHSFISYKDLSSNGFYYTKTTDRVISIVSTLHF
jgi:hypothetical protein